MKATILFADRSAAPRRLTVEWTGAATLAQLLGAAGVHEHPENVIVDSASYSVDADLDFVQLRDGSSVCLPTGQPVSRSRVDVADRAHVAVVAGEGAGLTVPMSSVLVLGSSPDCDVVLAGPGVAPKHAVLTAEPHGDMWIERRDGPLTANGQGVDERSKLAFGDVISIGESYLEVRPGSPEDVVAETVGNVFQLRRPPRFLPPDPAVTIEWPKEPAPPSRQPIPWLMTLAPVLMGVGLFLLTKEILMFMFIGISPLMMIANVITSRRSGKAFHRQSQADYEEALSQASEEVDSALAKERRYRLDVAPDPALVGGFATGPRRRLWERRRHDTDFLALRVGLGTLPSVVRREYQGFSQEPLEPLSLDRVPVVVPLPEAGVLGVAGPRPRSDAIARWLVAQAAVTSGPSDLQIVVLAGDGPDDESRWDWARWLPHTQSEQPGGAPMFGTTADTLESRVAELVDLIETRRESQHGNVLRSTDWPRVLVVMDPAYDIRRLPGVDIILTHGPEVGVHGLCVDTNDSYLPPECQVGVFVGEDGPVRVVRRNGTAVDGVLADVVASGWAVGVARALAACRDPEGGDRGGSIPSSARLVDLVGLEELDARGVLAEWEKSGRSTSSVVGVSASGPFALDLRTDGPHGLVAGTTGSGKSEFLQTLIASLAVVNRHDALNFLLVDYKGGSAFRDCAELPHTVGIVTDLDAHLTARALESLSAELKRREDILARGGAKDLDDYLAMGEPAGRLSRLLIVIDEFAGLVTELPDFVAGLVGIAQRGRSLGIHMILATQRPSGVVSPEIRANTNLRIALRVTTSAESADVIDAPEAARIMPTTPGRAYARTGHSALTPFQSARVGGPAAPAVTDEGPEIAVAEAGWENAGVAPRLARADTSGNVDPADTDLARLASVLIDAAEQSEIPRPSRPWLPPLPELVSLSSFRRPARSSDGVAGGPFGVVDLPASQRQEVISYHPGRHRHLALAGSSGSGRTTALRTIAVALAGLNRPDDVWMYVIDCGGGELRRLRGLPHVGAVVTRNEIDRTTRLLDRLHNEMRDRLERIAEEGHADITEQREAVEPSERIPYIVVFLDRWEGFMTTFDQIDNQRLTDLVIDIAREGGSAGIRLVATGDRSILAGRIAQAIDDRICFAMADPNDYSYAGLNVRKLPETMNPGRAIRVADVGELQIAVAGDNASGASQAAAVNELTAAWKDRATGGHRKKPFRVDVLPTEVSEPDAVEMLRQLRGSEPSQRPLPHEALIGVGGDELEAVSLDVLEAGGFLVAGPRRSGKSNTLLVMAHSVLANGCTVVAFVPRMSPLRDLEGLPGVAAVFHGDDPPVQEALEVLNSVEGPLVVMVDDAVALQMVPVAELLEHVATKGAEDGHTLVLAGSPEQLTRPMRGFIYQTVQSRSGIVLCPENTTDGDLLATRLPKSFVFRRPVGRGVLMSGGQPSLIQVPRAASSA